MDGPASARGSERKHIVHVFSTFMLGGPQRRTIDILPSLPPRFRHTILSMDNNFNARESLRAGVEIETIETPKDARGRVQRAGLRDILLRLHPDLLITYNWGATEAIQAIGLLRLALGSYAPILHTQDGFGPEEAKQQIPRRLWARRILYRFAEAVVVPSRNLERIAVEEWRLARRRVIYIPNGIDINKYGSGGAAARARFRTQFQLPGGAVVVGMVAHLRGEKNPSRLLRAFAARAPQAAYLVFVGDGPERAALERTAVELNIENRVRFAGHIPEPADAHAAFDIFALCSDTEQMPISVLEAMATGIPVVATHVGDIQEMVAPANREFITKLGDDGAFGEALAKLASDDALRTQIGAANRAKCAAHYSLEMQNNAYLDLYDRFTQPRALIWRSEHYRTN